MVISDANSYPVLLDSIDTPLSTDHFWVLDLNDRDFMLNELVMLEEITTPVIAFNVGGYVGESTRSEIDYAKKHGKPIRYLEEV